MEGESGEEVGGELDIVPEHSTDGSNGGLLEVGNELCRLELQQQLMYFLQQQLASVSSAQSTWETCAQRTRQRP